MNLVLALLVQKMDSFAQQPNPVDERCFQRPLSLITRDACYSENVNKENNDKKTDIKEKYFNNKKIILWYISMHDHKT